MVSFKSGFGHASAIGAWVPIVNLFLQTELIVLPFLSELFLNLILSGGSFEPLNDLSFDAFEGRRDVLIIAVVANEDGFVGAYGFKFGLFGGELAESLVVGTGLVALGHL